jgi:hypothetical protein
MARCKAIFAYLIYGYYAATGEQSPGLNKKGLPRSNYAVEIHFLLQTMAGLIV